MMGMQSQFLEQSQLQMKCMTQLIDRLGGSPQSPVHQDLNCIAEIGRELERIKSDLDRVTPPRHIRPNETGRRTRRGSWNPFRFIARICG
jgi:hypothetical protein